MKAIIAIGLGSFAGGILRYMLSTFIHGVSKSAFPYGTLLVNITGCFLIGLVFGLAGKGLISAEWRLYLATGFLGGFTTFSAFSIEMISLVENGRMMLAILYGGLSLLVGLSATYAGLLLGRSGF